MTVWAKIEATLSSTGMQVKPVVQPSPISMPPPPPPVKLKVKPMRSVTIEEPLPMAPPPVPVRKISIAIPSHAPRPPLPPAPGPSDTRKRKDSARPSDLDDMLGAEVDAMEKAHQPTSAIAELLEQPKSKKVKLPRQISPEKPRLPVEPPKKAKPRVEEEVRYISAPGYEQPRPPSDLPPTIGNSMPFRPKRARPLVASLMKDPQAFLVSRGKGFS
jgi:hypothetical protein